MNKNTTLFLLDNFRESVLFYGDVQYSDPISITLEGEFADDEAVCEEIFDLTNNPYRQTERAEKYGCGRSVSVGDIVGMENDQTGVIKFYVCAASGWVRVGWNMYSN